MIGTPRENTCSCGSGKSVHDCRCKIDGGQVIHFALGRRSNYHICMADMSADLIDYAQRYYYLWEASARTRFTSQSQIHELNSSFLSIFWHWFIANYRIHDDVSPIIDFYLAENEDNLGDREKIVLEALRQSYLSVYQVLWIKNNTMAVRDIFTEEIFTLDRDLGKKISGIINGALIFMRLVRMSNIVLPVGKPVILHVENKSRILQEMDVYKNQEGFNDPRSILQNRAEKLCGLILDLAHGQKNRVIAKSRVFESCDTRYIVKSVINSHQFIFLERNEKWLKYTRKNEMGIFSRLYIAPQLLIVVSENYQELENTINILSLVLDEGEDGLQPSWLDGYSFDYPEAAELFNLEIMHDMYLEEWMDSPLPELNDMSPLEAVADIKGRVLLASMLEDWETLELRAQSKGEYYLPVSVIRTKLNLDKNRFRREMLQPEAIAVQVDIYRSRQALDSYVWKYQWAGDDYQKVAAAAVDRFQQRRLSVEQLAWILYMWNEFSSIYHPAMSKPRGWLAALEYAYLECTGSPCGYGAIVKKYSVPIWSLSLRAQLIVRHFKRYPLDFGRSVVKHPKWDSLNTENKTQIYDEVRQHLRLYSYSYVNEEQAKNDFYESIKGSGTYWSQKTAQLFDQFFQDYILFDRVYEQGTTMAYQFWEDHACRFPSHLKAAAWNLMISCVGAYRATPLPGNRLLFEDIFTGKCCDAFGNFSHYVQEEIVPGMIVLTRLLPMNGQQWIREPFYVLLPDLSELFDKNLSNLMEKIGHIDEGDFLFRKKRGEYLIKAYIMALHDMEQNTLEALKKPLQLRWLKAELGEHQAAKILLENSRKFALLRSEEGITTLLWTHFISRSNNQWGYIILTGSSILVFAPPGKDINRMLKNLRQVLRKSDLIVGFRDYKARLVDLKALEDLLIHDLAAYLNSFPDQAMSLLRQDMLGDEEKEYEQGVFLIKLGSMLMDHLEEMC